MDLSYEAIQGGAKEVVVCHRGGFLSFPKVLNDFQVFGVKFDGDLPIDGLVSVDRDTPCPTLQADHHWKFN
jgi:dimethylaniline monooxygenase (N-oxide forming)